MPWRKNSGTRKHIFNPDVRNKKMLMNNINLTISKSRQHKSSKKLRNLNKKSISKSRMKHDLPAIHLDKLSKINSKRKSIKITDAIIIPKVKVKLSPAVSFSSDNIRSTLWKLAHKQEKNLSKNSSTIDNKTSIFKVEQPSVNI